jgi:hypothetical protein
VGSSQISNQLPVTIVGDSIKISFDVDLEEVIDVLVLRINLKLSMKSSNKKGLKNFLKPFYFL